MILGHCTKIKRYDLGASYVSFLNQEDVKLNIATIGKYLKLIYFKNQENCLETGKPCDKAQEEIITKHYHDLRKDYPVLDSLTLENVVLALSLTSRWKECLDLLKEIKITAVPTAAAYSAVIAAAFLNNEEALGWTLLDEILMLDKLPGSVSLLAYVKSMKKLRKKENAIRKLEKLFLYLQENFLKCNADVAVSIAELEKKFGFACCFTSVTYKGLCQHCSQTLDNFVLTDQEFAELKSEIFEKVIVGRDVFVKTNPEELEKFKKFTENMKQFDVVLDGLNIAYSTGTKHSSHVFSKLVASVVSHFVGKGKKVLVLGRDHMAYWPRNNWNYITRNASTFLTQNISQDDPYLLYCALASGKNTIIVTRDLMRSHKFLLRDARLKMLFNRWLSQSQYQLLRVDDKRGPTFRIPPPFSIVAQRNRGIWHIPYETDVPKDKNAFHRTWLCLKY